MTTKNEYHLKIMKMSNIEFEDINDEDIITWDYFDQGWGMRSWLHLYDPDGRLKDIRCCDFPLPESERLFQRPSPKKSAAMIEADRKREEAHTKKIQRQEAREAKKAAKKNKILLAINPGVSPVATKPAKKEKAKRNLTDSERNRRAIRMRAVALAYHAKKKNANVAS